MAQFDCVEIRRRSGHTILASSIFSSLCGFEHLDRGTAQRGPGGSARDKLLGQQTPPNIRQQSVQNNTSSGITLVVCGVDIDNVDTIRLI